MDEISTMISNKSIFLISRKEALKNGISREKKNLDCYVFVSYLVFTFCIKFPSYFIIKYSYN
jgi:hypothetical protein